MSFEINLVTVNVTLVDFPFWNFSFVLCFFIYFGHVCLIIFRFILTAIYWWLIVIALGKRSTKPLLSIGTSALFKCLLTYVDFKANIYLLATLIRWYKFSLYICQVDDCQSKAFNDCSTSLSTILNMSKYFSVFHFLDWRSRTYFSKVFNGVAL